jgi:hypothetical protein
LTDCNSRIIAATDILQWTAENVFNFLFRNVVVVYVRQACRQVDVIAYVHAAILALSQQCRNQAYAERFAAEPPRFSGVGCSDVLA